MTIHAITFGSAVILWQMTFAVSVFVHDETVLECEDIDAVLCAPIDLDPELRP